jgi:uncharacterized membrane protein
MDDLLIYYVVGTIVGIFISYFLFRWIFTIDKRVDQNKSIINLLVIFAAKQGATNDEIFLATKSNEDIMAQNAKL